MLPQVDASIPIVLNGETFCKKKETAHATRRDICFQKN